MKCLRVVIWTILSLLTISLSGCFSSNPKDIRVFLKPNEVDVSMRDYILHPPDEIELHCTDAPNIDGQRQQIRPDGRIRYEGIGELYVAGKTPAQIASELRTKILDLYQIEDDKSVDVRVVAYRSKRYYVLGQVNSPGAQVYTGRDTVLGALALAGSPTVLAWVDRIQVVRPSTAKNIKAKIFEFDFDAAAAHGDGSKDVLLQPGDIVYGPPTVLAAAAMKIEEFIRPIARAFSGYYLMGGGSTDDAARYRGIGY
ncbi:MAG: polysaccharide biosynthesis/export family protein [Planctomycetota bacterium]|jgi:polysaccharide export outer membrane protein